MLDVPVFEDDRTIGVLCAEHVGAHRSWQPWERELAAGLAEAAARLIEDARRSATAHENADLAG